LQIGRSPAPKVVVVEARLANVSSASSPTSPATTAPEAPGNSSENRLSLEEIFVGFAHSIFEIFSFGTIRVFSEDRISFQFFHDCPTQSLVKEN
jgi:hypothetical protein